jgi:hypothetical protein
MEKVTSGPVAHRAGQGGYMRNLITIAVVVVVGLLAFNYFSTGEFKILPGSSMSPEAREVNRLKGDFHRAAQEFRQAGRQAGISGMDTTAAAEIALSTVAGVERDLKLMRKDTSDPEVRAAIDDILAEIKKFKNDIM